MFVNKMGPGPWAEHQINDAVVAFEGLEIDCRAIQAENPVVVDVCDDGTGNLVTGTSGGRRYVASLIVPPKKFYEQETGETDIEGNAVSRRVSETFDPNCVKLNLWTWSGQTEVIS